MSVETLGLAAVDEDGVHFETGVPVRFEYARNTEPAPYFGAEYGQDIEPAGRYMQHNGLGISSPRGWEAGTVEFMNPLVLQFNTNGTVYGPSDWKHRLAEGLHRKGLALSKELLKGGYDGIVTVAGKYTSEIVDLRPAAEWTAECGHIQEWLYEYLATDVDPYDFQYLMTDWIEARGGVPDREGRDVNGHHFRQFDDPLEPRVDELTQKEEKEFKKWIKTSDSIGQLLRENAYDTPAYLTLHAKSQLPAGSWFIHFTNASFEAFDRGSNLEGLHLSTWKKRKDLANCARNLSDQEGLSDVVFGFAFDVDSLRTVNSIREASRKYGRQAVVFQCDCAVEAYHDGDEEDQSIFPVCSEYNVHHISSIDHYSVLELESDDGSTLQFYKLSSLVAYLERTPEERAVAKSPARAPNRSDPSLTSPSHFAAFFLAGAETGDAVEYFDDFEHDPRVPGIVAALARVGVVQLDGLLGQGSFGAAARTTEGRVVKLTSDPAEIQVGAVLVGKNLPHVVGIYGAWYIQGVRVNAQVGWDAEKEEEIRASSRVGVLIEQLVDTEELDDTERHRLSRTVTGFKHETGNDFMNYAGLSAKAKRDKLLFASAQLERLLRSRNRSLLTAVADALSELRSVGVYAIDVHGGNVGWDAQTNTYRIFDVGVGSPPPDAPKPATVFGGRRREEATRPDRQEQLQLAFEVGPNIAVREI